MGTALDHLHRLYLRLGTRWFRSSTLLSVQHDLIRLAVRLRSHGRRNLHPPCARLNVGCGTRKYTGWLNVDLTRSDHNVDLAAARLPWAGGSFDTIVSLHCIEHLELQEECLPLLLELHRLLSRGGEVWLACPDMKKICRAYLAGTLNQLLENRQRRWPAYEIGLPSSRQPSRRTPLARMIRSHSPPIAHMVNDCFHQAGEHKNLYDQEILTWALSVAGFSSVRRVDEGTLRSRFPEIPAKNDDCESIYMHAVKPFNEPV